MRVPFLLIFKGPKTPLLDEGIHELAAPDGEKVSLYLIPILSMGDRQQYQSVFN
jgi:hypothetical protein